jgi:hypothetical protein
MRNYKSVGYNYTYILLYITVIGIIYDSIGDFSFAYDNMYYLIVFLFMTIIISINEIIVDRAGIIKKFYLFPLKIKQLTWKEIKYYVEVDEEYNGQYGKSIKKRIWFIDEDDKVCLRINKKLRFNEEVWSIIDKYEDKAENKLTISDPYLMCRGWTKVNEYIKTKDKPKP